MNKLIKGSRIATGDVVSLADGLVSCEGIDERWDDVADVRRANPVGPRTNKGNDCLLYTSDAADE